jgi:hypothetical protein
MTSFQALPLLLALVAATPALAQNTLPIKKLNSSEIAALPTSWLSPANQPFRMAATVRTSVPEKSATATSQTKRANGAVAAVYTGLPATATQLLPTLPTTANGLFSFDTTGDSAQSWATMTADGVPHLHATGFGNFTVDATASWSTTVTIPAGGARQVVVRLVVPPTTVAGATEQQGPAAWRSRIRGELLVNGYPAWSTESLRLTTDSVPGNKIIVLQQFGDPLFYGGVDDEDTLLADGGMNNDSNAGSVNTPSNKYQLYLNLGTFNPGAVVDLSMILRASSYTQATSGGAHKCKKNTATNGWFCSRGTATVKGDTGEPPRIYLVP